MLQASGFDLIDQASPFLGRIVDDICADTETAEVMRVYIKFVQLVYFIYCENGIACWNRIKLYTLNKVIREFQKLGKQVFGCYQPARIVTQKWRLSAHLSEQIREAGGIQSIYAGLDNGSKKEIKAEYEKTSKRKMTTMDKTIGSLDMQIGCSSLNFNRRKIVFITNPAKAFATAGECAMLVRSEDKTSLAALNAQLFLFSSRRFKYTLFGGIDEISFKISDRLQENGLQTICCFLAENMSTLQKSASQADSTKLVALSLCNVSNVLCTKHSDGMDGDAIVEQRKNFAFCKVWLLQISFRGSATGASTQYF